MVECKNVKSEKMARYLARFTDGFRLWMHENVVYALFDIESLPELRELGKKLRRIRNIEFRYVKIQTVHQDSSDTDV